MKEIFKDIEGYEGLYRISNIGRIKSIERRHSFGGIKKEKLLKPQLTYDNYLRIPLWKNAKGKIYSVSRLVAKAFIDNPHNYPQVNHKDGNKLNNLIENLEWVTCSQNIKHAHKLGLKSQKGEKNNNAKLTDNQVAEIRLLLQTTTLTQKEISVLYNVVPNTISRFKTMKRRTYDYLCSY